MTENLFRLMRKEGDGVVVAGWEKHLPYDDEFGIRIYHKKESTPIPGREGTQHTYWDIMNSQHMSIIHHRKDRYTGIEVDGVKVFERDEAEYFVCRTHDTPFKGVVVYDEGDCAWGLSTEMYSSRFYEIEFDRFKITGIHGVKQLQLNEKPTAKYSSPSDIQDELIKQLSTPGDHQEAEEYVDKVLTKMGLVPANVDVTPLLKKLSVTYATYKRAFYESKKKDDIFYQKYLSTEKDLRSLTTELIRKHGDDK